MDYLTGKKIIYYTLIDLSLPLGPSVNELSFVRDMSRRYGANFVVVCPRPARISHLFPKNCRYEYIPIREIEKNSYQFFELRLKGIFSLRKQLKDIPPESSVVVSRLSILDVPAWFSRRELSRRSFFVRHSGNGLFENFATKSVIHSSVAKLAERINRMILESADCIDFLNKNNQA